jgi:hypothetical protein
MAGQTSIRAASRALHQDRPKIRSTLAAKWMPSARPWLQAFYEIDRAIREEQHRHGAQSLSRTAATRSIANARRMEPARWACQPCLENATPWLDGDTCHLVGISV